MKNDELRIGEVAAQAGVNIQTLRYYERRGVLPEPARTCAGYRAYAPETVRVVRFIKRAQELGFTVDEAMGLLRLRRVNVRRREAVRAEAMKTLDQIDEKLGLLKALAGALQCVADSSEGGSLEVAIVDAVLDATAVGASRGAATSARRPSRTERAGTRRAR